MRTTITAQAGARFQIVSELGRGSFGAVHEAIDGRTGQRVALKELGDMSAASVARFKQEFRALADCHHTNLVSLKELIEEGDRWLIVMELVPGSDPMTFVRGAADNDNATYDEQRLRSALAGMARGLAALHGYGILHRDLKPSNVRVTPQGRAVLLDFGLVTRVDPTQQSVHAGTFGTIAYMAPEQVLGKHVGAAADWYAFGVCLFELLTGRRPFEADTLYQVLADKQNLTAPRASSLVGHVSPELDELCAKLLERAPERRAAAADVFATLGMLDGADVGVSPLAPSTAARVPFAGREAELIQLQRALSRAHAGELKLVLVEGESGMGKSELVSEFVKRARESDPTLLPLYGRCYENEQVSYKAFDGCIDELARFLRELPENDCTQLLPFRASLLGQLFPVLRSVSAIATAPRGESSADPTARRLEAFAALIALFGKAAEERTLLLVIDDLQWADAESFRLLLAFAESPAPPPLLVVATIRPPEELEPDIAAALETLRRKQRIDVVQILGLPEQHASALVRTLLGGSAHEHLCQKIAEESGGHPLFLNELVHYVQSHDLAARRSLTIGAALRARIERLDSPTRALLELAALAGRPYGSHIFAAALDVASVDEPARTLLAAKLLRVRKSQELGCYHDRIRHSATSLIAKSRVSALHRKLAQALSAAANADAVEQARHWDLGGDAGRAAEAYEHAADAAYGALAFDRAAELCARARQLLDDARDPRSQRLLQRQGDALACAGRSAEAAALYERAVEQATGQQRYALRERHAQQLIQSGKLDLGIGLMRTLLFDLGLRLPKSQLATLLRIVLYRVWLASRRESFTLRAPTEDDQRVQFQSTVLRSFAMAISPLHPLALLLVTLQAVRVAVRSPRPEAFVLMYAALGWLRALRGAPSAAMFSQSRALAAQVTDAATIANGAFTEGSAQLMSWKFREAAVNLERAQQIVQTRCPDQPWLLRNIRYHLGMAWYALGEHRRVADEAERWIAEARERNDQLSIALLAGMGYGFVRHLMRDAPDDALLELETALRVLPKEPFSFVHFGELLAVVNSLLYKGGPAAHEWLSARASAHARPLLLRSPSGQTMLRFFRALAALHAYESKESKQRAALLRQARKDAAWVAKSPSPVMCFYGKLVLAQVHLLDGRAAEGLTCARAALAEAPESIHYQSRLAAYLEAATGPSGERDPRCEAVVDSFRAQGWTNPRGFVYLLLPAARFLAAPSSLRRAQWTLLLDRYEVVGSLGFGGFGTVVQARDVQTGRMLALKELVSKSARSLERFKQEFRALREVHHPNLVRLDALFEHDGAWYIAMELLHGHKLLEYTRPGGVADEARIRAVFGDLTGGLAALHDAGFAHRDLTPDNLFVTSEGRAVLLDFGLIGRLDDRRDEGGVGSAEYAAPEQLEGAPSSPAADVYGLGSCLYHALTGTLPFAGDTHPTLLENKRRERPPRRCGAALEPLESLAFDMLVCSPAGRPSLAQVRERLRTVGPEKCATTAHFSASDQLARFAGREEELASLADGFEQTCDQGVKVMLVEGESGLGKSALVSEFARRITAQVPNALVLRSRCYESEQVSHKAFDGAVDQLARVLRELPSPVCERLMPKRAALLGQLYPVLNTVPFIAGASKRGLPADLGVRRRASIACFVELLTSLSGRFELLILIDDLQWADSESFQLLSSLMDQRAALPLLIVATVRPSREISLETAGFLDALRARDGTESVVLTGLSDEAASEIARGLYATAPTSEQLRRLVDEAKGHPMFLRELVEQEHSSGAAAHGSLTLDEALRARILSFDEDARRLLSVVALAGRPYGSHVFARALHTTEPSRDALAALLARGLLRRSGSHALSPYHDRIARVALDLLAPVERQRLARDLATALDAESGADPGERARLWDECGEFESACVAYEQAADRALAALQFTRAAEGYARALERLRDPPDERWRGLLWRRGDALARAGRSSEAAEAYALAARGAQGEASVRLRTLAAEQDIQSAQTGRGLKEARALLAELGIRLPTSTNGALASISWQRMKLSFASYDPERPRQQLSQTTRLRLDAAWSLALPLSWLDPMAGTVLCMHHLRMALACGEPTHVARALTSEAFARVVYKPNDRKADVLLEQARALATVHGDPALEAEVRYRTGAVAVYRWDLEHALEQLEQALTIVTERCQDQPWLTTNVRLALGSAWFNAAQHARLDAAMNAWTSEARGRGDEFALTTLHGVGYGFLTSLMADDPSAVAAEIARHRSLWPSEPFSFIHLGDFIANSTQLLYRGGVDAAHWFDEALPALRNAPLLRTGTGRTLLLLNQAFANLGAWRDGPHARSAERLRAARALGTALSKTPGAFAAHVAPFVLAQVEVASGDREGVLPMLRRAYEAARPRGLTLHADRLQYLMAALEGGAAGRETRARLVSKYAEQGWKHPRQALRMFCPVLDAIEQEPPETTVSNFHGPAQVL